MRRFSKDLSTVARARKTKFPAAEIEPVTAVQVVEPSEPASSPYGALICAENWTAIDDRRRSRGVRRRQSSASSRSAHSTNDNNNHQEHLPHELPDRHVHRQAAYEQLCRQDELYEGTFQSLDRALRGTIAVNSTAEKLLVIIEKVMEEDSSSEGSGGMWEDPDSTLVEEGCPDCESPKGADSGTPGATVSDSSCPGGDSSERGTTSTRTTSSSSCSPVDVPAADQSEEGSLGSAVSSSLSPGAQKVTTKDLEVPERLLVTPPPSYAPRPTR